MFLSTDNPEQIIQLINEYPDFKPLYEEIYNICRNMEKVMGLFSEELRMMDRNTVQLMIDQMQETLEQKNEQLQQQSEKLEQQSEKLEQQSELLRLQEEKLMNSQLAFIARVRKKYLQKLSCEQCAQMLEEDPVQIRLLYRLLSAHPDLDDKEIFAMQNSGTDI